MLNVQVRSRRNIIENNNVVRLIYQTLRQMRSDKTGTAGYEDIHWFPIITIRHNCEIPTEGVNQPNILKTMFTLNCRVSKCTENPSHKSTNMSRFVPVPGWFSRLPRFPDY